MSVDLEQSLAQLAGSVHDDGAAERMTGQVRHMVTRIRRRRAARHAGQGVVGVGAAAAVAFGGVQLTGRPAPTPPATQAPTGITTFTTTAVCGEAPPEPPADARSGSMQLQAMVEPEVAYGEPIWLPTSLQWMTGDRAPVTWADATPLGLEMMVVQDGVVVSSVVVTFADDRPGLNPADLLSTTESYDFAVCGDGGGREPLPPGDYTIVATERLLPADGGEELVVQGGPWDLTVADPDAAAPSGEELSGEERSGEELTADAERAVAAAELAALLARSPSGTFPTCGSAVPTDDDAPLTLDLDPALGTDPVAPGARIGTWVDLRTTGGRQVMANVPITGAVLVVVKDGVVVGKDFRDVEDVSMLSLGAEGSVQVSLTGSLSLCSDPVTEIPTHSLPPGTYDVMAVMDVMLKEVVEADGEAVSTSDLLTVRSNSVTVTVG